MKLINIIFILLVPIFLLGCNEEDTADYSVGDSFEIITGDTDSQLEFEFDVVRIMSFNIQIFGQSKASKPEVMSILAEIIDDYDLVAIQEIRDASGTAILQLMELLPENYALSIGPREGRTRSKEQYAIIYDTDDFSIIGEFVYPDENDVLERNPHAVHFQSTNGVFDFVIINNHISPGDAEVEIEYMPNVISIVETYFGEPDIIIVGDFNADGSYYDEDELVEVFNMSEYSIVIPNSADTTVAASDNTYDRIIITDDALEDFTGIWGVYNFEEEYDFFLLPVEGKEVSDHYPVWAEFYTSRDTD